MKTIGLVSATVESTKHFPIKRLSHQQQLSQMSKSHLQKKQPKLLFAWITSYNQFCSE